MRNPFRRPKTSCRFPEFIDIADLTWRYLTEKLPCVDQNEQRVRVWEWRPFPASDQVCFLGFLLALTAPVLAFSACEEVGALLDFFGHKGLPLVIAGSYGADEVAEHWGRHGGVFMY